MSALLRRLPPGFKAWAWKLIDRLGDRAFRMKTGPARGSLLVAPPSRCRPYCGGSHEPHVVALLTQIVQPGMIACDIGSHLGYFTLTLAQLVGPTGHVYSFEPLPHHIKCLTRSKTLNQLNQITIVPRVVGRQDGAAMLEIWPNDAMSLVVSDSQSSRQLERIEVPATTLDTWATALHEAERIGFIKLDIEGQELAALQGASDLLAYHRPLLVCEIHRRSDVPYQPRDILGHLDAAGYDVRLVPSPQRPKQTLHGALARLEATRLPPGWMAAVHVLATPRRQ